MELNISEAELIEKIGRHFTCNRVIPTSMRMQNINNFRKLFDLLQECDNDDESYKERMARKNQSKNFQNSKVGQKSPKKKTQGVELQKTDGPQSNGNKNGKFQQSANFSKNNYNGNKNRNNGNNHYTEKSNQAQIRKIEVLNSNKKQNEKNPPQADSQGNE